VSRPERGARFLFELAGVDEHEARYALTVFTPSDELRTEVRIAAEGGDVRFVPEGDASDLLGEARALAKTLYNQRRADERGRWKRRLMRWRE
jgi:hypothetical protein